MGRNKLLMSDVKNRLKEINPNIKILSSKFINSNTKMDCICLVCGHNWGSRWNNLIHGYDCPICARNKSRKNKKYKDLSKVDIEIKLKEIKPNITVIEYLNWSNPSKRKFMCKCTECGYIWESNIYKLLDITKHCNKCSSKKGKSKTTIDDFKLKLQKINNKITVIAEEYINSSTKIECKCNICNHIWEARPNDLLGIKSGCPLCNKSKGESRILDYLDCNKVYYIYQKEFDKLIGLGGRNLSYDFYLCNQKLLIEYQGEFHDGTAKLQTDEEFVKQKEHDRRKKQYAKDNDIKLLPIWYWDFDNIEKILDKELNKAIYL